MSQPFSISVIIVNYNVRDFLEQALISIKRALKGIPAEILVVDNNSVDGSVNMIHKRFRDVKLIASKKNLGFSGGNNLALKKVKGEFVVLINPDTVVQEDTFSTLLEFFAKTPDASAVTCKILNPDGSFSIDCRHSIPTPSIAFWKLTGLNRLFPKSKIFGRYNLTYLDENEIYPVEAISGSFIMIKNEMVKKIGLLDETFFMYCEDIDYCHRINHAGGKIYYVPTTQIVHYKGESSKANNLDYVITFNKSLYHFYKKHYQQKYIYPFKWLILLGVIIRGIIIYTKNIAKKTYPVLIDLIILNATLFFSFWFRYTYKHSFSLHDFFSQYIIINFIATFIYTLNALFFDIVNHNRFLPEKVFRVIVSTFTFVAAIVFFFKQFAFSRFVVLITAIVCSILMIGWRLLLDRFGKKYSSALDKEFFSKRTLIVGDDKETVNLLQKLRLRVDSRIDIVGIVSIYGDKSGQELDGLPVVTSIDQVSEYVRIKRIGLILFSTHNIPYKTILETMTKIENHQVEFKMVPGHLEYMIGKSNIEPLDNVPMVDIDYAYGKIFNRFSKRVFDFTFASLLMILLFPLDIPFFVFWGRKIRTKKMIISGNTYLLFDYSKKGLGRFLTNLLNIFTGRMSFVGSPLEKPFAGYEPVVDYRPGITGILQINKTKIINNLFAENLELHYLKNQSLFMDIEILLKAILKK